MCTFRSLCVSFTAVSHFLHLPWRNGQVTKNKTKHFQMKKVKTFDLY